MPAEPRDVSDDPGNEFPASVDEAAVERLGTIAYLLDSSIRVPGTRFRIGLDPILGLLPGAGDALSAGISVYIIVESRRLGVSSATLVKMLANVAVDTVVGSVPVIGDLLDAAWKANQRNVDLARRDLSQRANASISAGVDDDMTEGREPTADPTETDAV